MFSLRVEVTVFCFAIWSEHFLRFMRVLASFDANGLYFVCREL